MTDEPDETRRQIERVARTSYGKLVAWLTGRTNDLAAAEDALSDALVAALRTWPRDGVPAAPEAWLLTTARHVLISADRHRRVVTAGESALRVLQDMEATPPEPEEFSDRRIELFFVCAHPAIEPSLRAPLMLQVVLGLPAVAIAPVFLVSPTAMSQRLVRAKAHIRDAGVRFEIPGPRELPRRLSAVLEAIYAAFTVGWEAAPGLPGDTGLFSAPDRTTTLAGECVWLARDLQHLLPDEPEVLGLLALLLYAHARRMARRASDGAYVLLDEQDTRRWDHQLIAEAETLLSRAAEFGRPGRFQLEAAIQSAHMERAHTGCTEWRAIAEFYDQLVGLTASLGARTARAAARAEATGAAAGLCCLDGIDAGEAAGYQPYWAVRGHLLGELGRHREACAAYDRAIELSGDPAVCEYLRSKREALARHGS